MYRFASILPFLFLASSVISQVETEWQRQLEGLKIRVNQLEHENRVLKANGRTADSLDYCAIRQEIFEAFSNESQLIFDFKSTTEKISITGLFTRLMQANNPSSDILGFRFNELVMSSAEKHFKGMLENDSDKRRFTQVIAKIINNPLVSTLAGSNPVTSVVATIISALVGFTTTSLCVDKEGGRVKDVSVGQHDVFGDKSFEAFRSEMKVYIDFYDRLSLSSRKYLEGLETLRTKYSYLMFSVNNYLVELHYCIQADAQNDLLALTLMLPDPATPGIDFQFLLKDQGILQAAAIATRYPALQMQVSDFKNEYNLLLLRFLEDYIQVLLTAKNFPDQAIDKSRIDLLIKDIQDFITSQHLAGYQQIGVFSQ